MRIGIDIGGTKTHAVALDDSWSIIDQVRMPSGKGITQVLQTARATIVELRGRLDQPVESVGIGIPGHVDSARGIVRRAVNLQVPKLHLAAGLQDLVDGPICIDNDVNAAALGAYSTMPNPPDSLAYLNIGTGLAAGLILNGKLWRGFDGIAGEIGHIVVEPGGRSCACGQHGCLETVASGTAIINRWSGAMPFAEALRKHDPAAFTLLDQIATGISQAIRFLVLTAGIEVIVLGGGVIAKTPYLVETLNLILGELGKRSALIETLELPKRVRVNTPENNAPALGAARLTTSNLG